MDPMQLVETARAEAEPARREVVRRARDLIAGRYFLAVLFAAVGFALLARTVWYFPIDLQVTRAIQDASPAWLDVPLGAITWIGFPPQSNIIFGTIIVGLILIGRRLEALMLAFAAAGSAGLWYAINPL